MNRSIKFYLNQRTFEIPYEFSLISKIPDEYKEIQNEIGFKHEYHVNSIVQNETFQSFLNYWVDKSNVPEITFDNFWDFFKLNDEFGIMKDIINDKRFLDFANLSILINTDDTSKFDKHSIECYISSHLSHYINNFENELGKVPIQNLYNIFNNCKNDLQNHDEAFSFIVNQVKQTNNDKYYILIDCLEMNKINNQENIKNLLLNFREFFGFIPHNLNVIFDRQQEEVQNLKKQLSIKEENNQNLQQQISNKDLLIKENEEKIKNLEKIIKDHEEKLKIKEQQITQNEENIKDLQQKLSNKDLLIKEKEDKIRDLEKIKEDDKEKLTSKDQQITKNEENIKDLQQKLTNKDLLVKEKEDKIEDLEKIKKDDIEKLKIKDQQITQNEKDIKHLKEQLDTKNNQTKEFLIQKANDLKFKANNYSFKNELTSDSIDISCSIGTDNACKFEHKVNGVNFFRKIKESLLQQLEQTDQMNNLLQNSMENIADKIIPLIPLDDYDEQCEGTIRELFKGIKSVADMHKEQFESNSKLFVEFQKLEYLLVASALKFFKEDTVKLINGIAKDLEDFITNY